MTPASDEDDDPYRTVTAVLRQVRYNDCLIEDPRGGRQWVSVPYSLMHAADERAIDRRDAGRTITFRLREWKAEELGLP